MEDVAKGRGERMPRPFVVVVTLSCSLPEFLERLGQVPGTRYVRELPPHSAVVVLSGPGVAEAISALAGVVNVVEDRLEHLTGDARD